jgi:uncharacterized protein (TIGR02186 family)
VKAACATCALATLFAILLALPADAELLVSSLSNDVVKITSSFNGVELVLFGTVESDAADKPLRPSYDLVVTAIGPRQNLATWRKSRVAGIWVNAESRAYRNVPSYLAVLANRPFLDIAGEASLRREEIGLANAALPQQAAATTPADDAFRAAFLRLRKEDGFYFEDPKGVTFLTPNLYRASIFVPAEAQVGSYLVDVKLFADGAVVARSHSAFEIVTVGFEHFMALSAIDHGFLYGLATAAMAMMTGWFASIVFRRD